MKRWSFYTDWIRRRVARERERKRCRSSVYRWEKKMWEDIRRENEYMMYMKMWCEEKVMRLVRLCDKKNKLCKSGEDGATSTTSITSTISTTSIASTASTISTANIASTTSTRSTRSTLNTSTKSTPSTTKLHKYYKRSLVPSIQVSNSHPGIEK